MSPTQGVIGTFIYVNAVSSWGHVEARLAAQDTVVGARAVLTPPSPTHWVSIFLTLINIHTLPTLWGGLEAGLTQTVEGALRVDTAPSQTGVCGCTLIHILAVGAPLSTGKTGCTETEEGPVAVEALAVGSTVLLPHALVYVLTGSAVGQLEPWGTEALEGTCCVLTFTSQAAALGIFTLIHIFAGVFQRAGPIARITILAGEGAHGVGTDSCAADPGESTLI